MSSIDPIVHHVDSSACLLNAVGSMRAMTPNDGVHASLRAHASMHDEMHDARNARQHVTL